MMSMTTVETCTADGKLIHHENEQFFNLPWIMSDLEHIGIV